MVQTETELSAKNGGLKCQRICRTTNGVIIYRQGKNRFDLSYKIL